MVCAGANMNGWNRVFVVIAVVWTLVAPFLLLDETNKPTEMRRTMCSDTAYRLYGSSSSVKLDMDKYNAETAKCSEAFIRNFVSLWANAGFSRRRDYGYESRRIAEQQWLAGDVESAPSADIRFTPGSDRTADTVGGPVLAKPGSVTTS